MELGIRGDDARELSEKILNTFFKTQGYPYTRHSIDSYDQFVSQDLPAIIKDQNPLLLLHSPIGNTGFYTYKAEVFIGGLDGSRLYIGTPTISLQDSKEIRVLLPNEARLRNLTYSSAVQADIVIRITYSTANPGGRGVTQREVLMDPAADSTQYGYLAKFPLFKLPIMLHSKYCILHDKPAAFIKEAGECQYDYGGYFVVEGSEKVLITHQEQAFNVLNITPQERDPKIAIFSAISCLNPTTRRVKRVAFGLMKRENTLLVSLPLVRKPIPIFVVFRALGIQSDEDILRMIFPDPEAAETKILQPLLHESILEATPFYDTYSAVQYIKVLTKGFSEAHVLDILHNQTFIHVEDRPKARAFFLAECVRRILRVKAAIDPKTDRDDLRNQRCLTAGILTRMLFQGVYTNWFKAVRLTLDKERNFNEGIYEGDKYQNLFLQGTLNQMFKAGMITENLMRAFKGKWSSGTGAGVGEEKSGVIQALSRLSYMDFMSHCRRVVLDFDTGMKLPGPRRLHTSQYGYFCTSETPGGASIGITKNLSMLTSISVATDPKPILDWLFKRGGVIACNEMTPGMLILSVPVFVNAGIIGYTLRPVALRDTLKVLKWTGCLPASASVGFSVRDRRVFLFVDEGRPMRPLIHLGPRGKIPIEALQKGGNWRNLVMGVLPHTAKRGLSQGGFMDPFSGEAAPTLESYVERLAPDAGVIEYMDPYEMNECFIANFPENIQTDTTHLEVHPSTIVGLLTSMIPYAHHNQSPRNQLSCSQSKQGLSVYSTAFQNRFDNQVHVLCYGQAPLVRTLYYDYLAEGQMGYGHNLILAMGSFTGYNQDDGILMNADSFARGMFRSTFYRSYEAFEEDDPMTHGKTRIGNPANIPGWTSLKPGVDYSKLDERGLVRVGELVDETSVLVGMYLQGDGGEMRDASVTAQVWTRGRVEKVSVTVNNMGLAMVKVRVVQERIPELGDKFCLTPEHEVLTESGWVAIDKVNTGMKVAQLNKETEMLEYVNPNETFEFDHTGDMYEFATEGGGFSQKVTDNHRMYVANSYGKKQIILAKDLLLSEEAYWFITDVGLEPIFKKEKSKYKGFVYCISVPSQIFLVRNSVTKGAAWTGNSNRHGQKGTIGMLMRGHDMPRTAEGIPVDMIMNPHAIPSRMTVAQLIEALVGKAAPPLGTVGNGTLFMNDGNPVEAIGAVLRDHLGMEPFGEELMYDGMSGQLIPTQMFIGNVYTMRLKHMPEDKWNARSEGRREQRTHQPTGGRGAQGGLRIGEMERDAILGHGIADFLRESIMKRADGYETIVCNGCGTIPIYNEREGLTICTMCDGPVKYIGETANTLEILPPLKRSVATFSKIEIPYAFKLLDQEMNAYLNMGMRVLTEKDVKHFRGPPRSELTADEEERLLSTVLPQRVLLDTEVPEMIAPTEEPEVKPEDLTALGLTEEEEVAEAPPAVTTTSSAIGPATNSFTIQLPAGMTASSASDTLQETSMDDVPFTEEEISAPPSEPVAANNARSNGVNVQTTSQPVLVIPMNIGTAAPTEAISPPMPGAPTTLAVDTSERAMRGLNLPATGQNRRSNSGNRAVGSVPARANAVVNVQREGSTTPTNSNANVRVSVTKQG
jgi:DNA-directed RNA polymerase II subunit RPB2